MPRLKNDGKGRMGGRKSGTPNKVTKELRSLIKEFVEGEFPAFKDRLEQCKPADFCKLYIDMCKFVIPALSSVDLNDISKEGQSSFTQKLRDMRDAEDVIEREE